MIPPSVILQLVASQHKVFLMHHTVLYAVHRKFCVAYGAVAVLAQNYQLPVHVMSQIKAVAAKAEQR